MYNNKETVLNKRSYIIRNIFQWHKPYFGMIDSFSKVKYG